MIKTLLTRKFFLIGLFSFGFGVANATTWYVNDNSLTGDVFTSAVGNDANAGSAAAPFATVQFAIDAANAGDTIYVDAGTYASGDINITKAGLVLRGAKYGVSAGPEDTPAGRGTDETNIQGSFYYGQSLDNISVDGFSLEIGNAVRGIQARGLNSVIINNIVTGTLNLAIQQQGIATRANGPLRLHSYLISHNNVRGLRFGIYMDGNIENASEISYNYVSNCFTAGYVLTASNGHHFKANVAENNGTGLLVQKGSNIIDQNTFEGNFTAGVRLAATAATSGNSIVNNFFNNNAIAINLTQDNAGAVNNQANYNAFSLNPVNIFSEHSGTFNAQCNWYGTTNPGIIAAQITGSGPVTFNPFLTDGTDTDPIDGFQPITACVVVPVVLTSFNATVKNYNVLLDWQTSSEVNSSHFNIERSLDGQHFNSVGRVEAQGFSSVKVNYNFTDKKPMSFDKPVFYRIQMVDRDGSFKYTKVVSVILKTNGSFVNEIYPNPVQAAAPLHVNFISASNQRVNILFVNATGQTIQRYQVQAFKGSNQFDLKVPAAATAGTYFLLIKADDINKQVPLYIH